MNKLLDNIFDWLWTKRWWVRGPLMFITVFIMAWLLFFTLLIPLQLWIGQPLWQLAVQAIGCGLGSAVVPTFTILKK